MKNNLNRARKNILKRSKDMKGVAIKGYDFSGKFDVALPTGAYKVAIRHPKLGKVEDEVLINALETTKVGAVLQFK